MIKYVHYTNNIIIGILVLLTLFLFIYSYQYQYEVNTWQFPMTVAIFLDAVFIMSI